jgi:hypothetical protein
MFIASLILFAAAMLLLGAYVARGLTRIDDILEVVDTRESDAQPAPIG